MSKAADSKDAAGAAKQESDWQAYVEVDQAYFRPAEVPDLRGDASKARSRLGWRPKISFHEMIREMLEHDLAAAGLNPGTHLREQAAKAS